MRSLMVPIAGMLVPVEMPAQAGSVLVQVLVSGSLAYRRVGKPIWAPDRWARKIRERSAAALAAGGERWAKELGRHETDLRRWRTQAELAWSHPFSTSELVALMDEGVSLRTGRVLVLPDRLPIARTALAALVGHRPGQVDACEACSVAGGEGAERFLYAHRIPEQAVRDLFLGLVAAQVVPMPSLEQVRPSDPREVEPDLF